MTARNNGKSIPAPQGNGRHPSKKNITSWVLGESGNPKGGTPKAVTIASIWREIMEAREDPDGKRTWLHGYGEKLKSMAMEGNIAAGRLLLERAYGLLRPTEGGQEPEPDTGEVAYLAYLRAHPTERGRYIRFLEQREGAA